MRQLMPAGPIPIDESVRRLSELRWTTRAIARYLMVSQSTVVRARKRINTGPNPIVLAGTAPPGEQDGGDTGDRPAEEQPKTRTPTLAPVLIAAAVLLITATAAGVLWVRFLHPPAPSQQVPQVSICVRYAPAGTVTGVTAGGGCPPGWKTVTLVPGR